MRPTDASRWASGWIDDWNRHDLEAILSHYAEGVVFLSPVAAQVVPRSNGELHGVEALRSYWSTGLPLRPKLQFSLSTVLTTVGGLTLIYGDERGQLVAETMLLDADEKVIRGIAAYPPRTTG